MLRSPRRRKDNDQAMQQTAEARYISAYRSQFDRLAGGDLPDWLRACRGAAMERFETLGLPTRKLEDWKYTNLAALARTAFAPAEPGTAAPVDLDDGFIPGLSGPRVVFANGLFDPKRSDLAGLPDGVTLLPLREALNTRADLVQQILDAESPDNGLRALNTALLADGFLLHVAANVAADAPITVVHATGDGFAERAAQLRHIVVLDDNARASLVEIFIGTGTESYWANPVRDLRCGAGACLETVTIIDEGAGAVHTGHSEVRLDREARSDQVALLIGGATVRHELRVAVAGEGAQANLAGACLGANGQSFTVFTELDHQVPHGRSNQVFRSVLDAGAHSAYQGRVVVRKGAQKTDASQANHNLLLDRSAEADTKPELEIYADDVKCAHGATVGELDGDMLFYLQSRGIDPDTARSILVEAFVGEVVEKIAHTHVRDKVADMVSGWMKRQGAAIT